MAKLKLKLGQWAVMWLSEQTILQSNLSFPFTHLEGVFQVHGLPGCGELPKSGKSPGKQPEAGVLTIGEGHGTLHGAIG